MIDGFKPPSLSMKKNLISTWEPLLLATRTAIQKYKLLEQVDILFIFQ